MPEMITPEMTGFDPDDPSRFTPYRPLLLKIVDKIVYALDRVGLKIMVLDEEKLIRKACGKTGLSDFGEDSFREPLKILCEHSRTGKPMTFVGRKKLGDELLKRLENKLKIQADITGHPEILDQKIEKPIFIQGLPRTGTTLLFNLLVKDPAHRAPLLWEMDAPSPPPDPASYDSDPRLLKARNYFKVVEYVAPASQSIHELGADLPEECFFLMANDLHGHLFYICWDSPPYEEWLLKQDMSGAYQSHKRQLQLLQWKFDRKTWVLKYPAHMYWLKNLLSVYPDARIVQTHRDPVKVMPSLASLLTNIRAPVYDDIDPACIGARALDHYSFIMERSIRSRQEEEKRESSTALFHDVYFTDLVTHPMETIEKLYDAFDIELSDEARENMVRYLDESPRHKLGKHVYTLEQYGFEESAIRERFRGYCERFGL